MKMVRKYSLTSGLFFMLVRMVAKKKASFGVAPAKAPSPAAAAS